MDRVHIAHHFKQALGFFNSAIRHLDIHTAIQQHFATWQDCSGQVFSDKTLA